MSKKYVLVNTDSNKAFDSALHNVLVQEAIKLGDPMAAKLIKSPYAQLKAKVLLRECRVDKAHKRNPLRRPIKRPHLRHGNCCHPQQDQWRPPSRHSSVIGRWYPSACTTRRRPPISTNSRNRSVQNRTDSKQEQVENRPLGFLTPNNRNRESPNLRFCQILGSHYRHAPHFRQRARKKSQEIHRQLEWNHKTSQIPRSKATTKTPRLWDHPRLRHSSLMPAHIHPGSNPTHTKTSTTTRETESRTVQNPFQNHTILQPRRSRSALKGQRTHDDEERQGQRSQRQGDTIKGPTPKRSQKN